MVNAVGITKAVATLVVSTGVGTIVGNALRQTTPENAKVVKKVSTYVGAYALSTFLAAKTADYVEEQIDGYADAFRQGKNAVKKVKDQTNITETVMKSAKDSYEDTKNNINKAKSDIADQLDEATK